MSYQAIVAPIRVRPHPNADKLQLGTVLGNQVVVGLDTLDGELGVFFPSDGQLSEQMVLSNNLYSKSALDKLGISYDATDRFGFFSERRRVRAQSFRGEKSDGFWVPLSNFTWTGFDTRFFYEGLSFTELNGHAICNKYETPATRRARSLNPPKERKRNKMFAEHNDTKQYRFFAHAIPEDALLVVTEKLHGTSGRYGHVREMREMPKWKRTINSWLGPVFKHQYDWIYLNGSRRVVLDSRLDRSGDANARGGFYGSNEFRFDLTRDITLHKGEVLYFEIVGYYTGDRGGVGLIMGEQQVKGLKEEKLKEVRNRYGDVMQYTYGCQVGEHRMYVYKIALVNEDGIAVEQPWSYVKRRCAELGLEHVPEITIGLQAQGALGDYLDTAAEGSSLLDPRHIREGVVLRVESATQDIVHYKHKSWTFGVLEGFWKEQDDAVDMEEIS